MGYIDPKLVEGAAALVESFTCAICFNLFEKPRTACSKGHTFCAECLTAARFNPAPDNCPTCREVSSVSMPSKPLENCIDELRIRCCHGPDATTAEERGAKRQRTGAADAPEEVVPGDCCKWVGRVTDYPAHLANDCQLEPHACPFYGCDFKGTRKELAQHYVDAAAEHASEACAKIESLEALVDETTDNHDDLDGRVGALGECLETLDDRVDSHDARMDDHDERIGDHAARIRTINNSVSEIPQLKQQASSLKFFQNCTVVNLDFALEFDLLKAVYKSTMTRTIELGSCNVWSGLDLRLKWLVRKSHGDCPLHSRSHSLILELVPLCPNMRELIYCFGKLAPVDKESKTINFHVRSRSNPLQFNHKALSHSLPLGSFEDMFGQERFLHSGNRYYLKARLYFSSPWRESSLNGDPARWSIYVHNMSGQKLRLKVSPYDLCLALKPKIRDKWNAAVAQQRLVFRGQQLVDGSKLYDSSIFDGAVVHLIVRTRVPPPQPLPPI